MYILDGVERGLRISIDNSVDTVKVTNTEAEPCVPENLYSSLFVSIFLFRTDRNFHTHQLILFIWLFLSIFLSIKSSTSASIVKIYQVENLISRVSIHPHDRKAPFTAVDRSLVIM